MALWCIFAAVIIVSVESAEVCKKSFYIAEDINMFSNYTDLISVRMDCSQPGFPSLLITVEEQLREEITETTSRNAKVAISLKCVLNNETSYQNSSLAVKRRSPWVTTYDTNSNLPLGQNCSMIGCFWDEYYDQQRRYAVRGSSCITNHNECASGTSGCSQICTDTFTGYDCSCMDGYRLEEDLHNCTDIDECSNGDYQCSHYCRNTEGSYVCDCPKGYYLENDNLTCSDVDECAEGSSLCQHQCVNTVGSYECGCYAGYQLDRDKAKCKDIDECDPDLGYDHHCDQICENIPGGFKCACETGMLSSDNHRCLEKNECENPKVCSQVCVNSTTDGYHCRCRDGYTLNDDGHNCTANPSPQNDQMVLYMSWVFPLAFAFFLLLLSLIISFSIVRRRKHGSVLENNPDLYDFYLTQEKLDYNYQPVDLSHGLSFDSASLRSDVTSFHSASNTVDDLAKLSASEKTQIVLVAHDTIFSNKCKAINSNSKDDFTGGEKSDEENRADSVQELENVLDCAGNRKASENSDDSCVGSSIAGDTSPDFHTSTILCSSDTSDAVFDHTGDTSASSDYIETGCISGHTHSLSLKKQQNHPSTVSGSLEEADTKQQQQMLISVLLSKKSSSKDKLCKVCEAYHERVAGSKYIHATNTLFAVSDDTTSDEH